MPWSRTHRDSRGRLVVGQVETLQAYRRGARLTDEEYQTLLYVETARRSSRDPALQQGDFDRVMRAIEAVLEYRIAEGFVAREKLPRVIRDLRYWRRKDAGGSQTQRQRRKWEAIWRELLEWIDITAWHGYDGGRTAVENQDAYLAAFATQATRCSIGDVHHLDAWQASVLIDALNSRLAQEVAKRR